MSGSTGDFEALYDLLSGAKERYRSVRATVTHTVDADVASEANRRFVDWRFDQGSPGMAIVGKPGPPKRKDFYHEYEDFEERIELWHQRPDRWREEIHDTGGLRVAEAYGGERGPRWVYERDHPEQGNLAVYMPELPRGQDLDTKFTFMLDPSEYIFQETFWDGTTTEKTDRKVTVAGRECIEVRAETVSWGYPACIP